MKKNIIIMSLIMFITSQIALADGIVFDPTEYPKNPEIDRTQIAPTPEQLRGVPTAKNPEDIAKNTISGQSESFNNALFELDSAQVNIRNELLEYKAKYQEIDTQYQLIKNERRILDEQIKTIERRIKEIENSKIRIRKTMGG